MRIRDSLLAGIAAATLMNAPAHAVVFTSAVSVTNVTNSTATYSFALAQPVSPISGLVSTRLDVGFALADGARDGAVLGIGSVPGGLVTASTGKNGTSDTTVLQSGAPQSFAAAGGAAGTVIVSGGAAANISASNVTSSTLHNGGSVSGSDRTLHVAAAGVVVDGSAGDGAAFLPGINPSLVTATLAPAGSVGTGTATGPTPFVDGFSGSNSISGLNCAAASCALSTLVSFTVGPTDAAGLVSRTEVGREGPPGDVTWTYIPGVASGIFDCGVGGCDFLKVLASFSLSSRDATSVVMRFEIVPLSDVPVPAPAALPLLASALAGLEVLRRRARV